MVNVEQLFNDYVKSIGGELVSELLPKSPSFKNADYLFRQRQSGVVIAELKCLTKDLLKEGYQERLDWLLNDWINRRLIPPEWGQRELKSRDLPPACQEELFEMLGRNIKKVVIDANKQIKQTKTHFGLNDAKGLLLLVNDGNYSLEFNIIQFLLNRALGHHCSGINSVVCLTVNMTTRMPSVDGNCLVWAPAHRKGIPRVSPEFLDAFRNGLVIFHGKTIGEPVSTFTAENSQSIEQIKLVHPPEPREYYKTRNRALVNLRQKIIKQLDLIISSCRLYDVGKREEAIHIAVATCVILHGRPNVRALVRDYFGDHEIKLKTSTMIGEMYEHQIV